MAIENNPQNIVNNPVTKEIGDKIVSMVSEAAARDEALEAAKKAKIDAIRDEINASTRQTADGMSTTVKENIEPGKLNVQPSKNLNPPATAPKPKISMNRQDSQDLASNVATQAQQNTEARPTLGQSILSRNDQLGASVSGANQSSNDDVTLTHEQRTQNLKDERMAQMNAELAAGRRAGTSGASVDASNIDSANNAQSTAAKQNPGITNAQSPAAPNAANIDSASNTQSAQSTAAKQNPGITNTQSPAAPNTAAPGFSGVTTVSNDPSYQPDRIPKAQLTALESKLAQPDEKAAALQQERLAEVADMLKNSSSYREQGLRESAEAAAHNRGNVRNANIQPAPTDASQSAEPALSIEERAAMVESALSARTGSQDPSNANTPEPSADAATLSQDTPDANKTSPAEESAIDPESLTKKEQQSNVMAPAEPSVAANANVPPATDANQTAPAAESAIDPESLTKKEQQSNVMSSSASGAANDPAFNRTQSAPGNLEGGNNPPEAVVMRQRSASARDASKRLSTRLSDDITLLRRLNDEGAIGHGGSGIQPGVFDGLSKLTKISDEDLQSKFSIEKYNTDSGREGHLLRSDDDKAVINMGKAFKLLDSQPVTVNPGGTGSITFKSNGDGTTEYVMHNDNEHSADGANRSNIHVERDGKKADIRLGEDGHLQVKAEPGFDFEGEGAKVKITIDGPDGKPITMSIKEAHDQQEAREAQKREAQKLAELEKAKSSGPDVDEKKKTSSAAASPNDSQSPGGQGDRDSKPINIDSISGGNSALGVGIRAAAEVGQAAAATSSAMQMESGAIGTKSPGATIPASQDAKEESVYDNIPGGADRGSDTKGPGEAIYGNLGEVSASVGAESGLKEAVKEEPIYDAVYDTIPDAASQGRGSDTKGPGEAIYGNLGEASASVGAESSKLGSEPSSGDLSEKGQGEAKGSKAADSISVSEAEFSPSHDRVEHIDAPKSAVTTEASEGSQEPPKKQGPATLPKSHTIVDGKLVPRTDIEPQSKTANTDSAAATVDQPTYATAKPRDQKEPVDLGSSQSIIPAAPPISSELLEASGKTQKMQPATIQGDAPAQNTKASVAKQESDLMIELKAKLAARGQSGDEPYKDVSNNPQIGALLKTPVGQVAQLPEAVKLVDGMQKSLSPSSTSHAAPAKAKQEEKSSQVR